MVKVTGMRAARENSRMESGNRPDGSGRGQGKQGDRRKGGKPGPRHNERGGSGGRGPGKHGGPKGRPHGRRRKPEVAVKGHADRYWIYGWHSVLAALQNPARTISRLWVSENAEAKLKECPEYARAEEAGIEHATSEMFARVLNPDAIHQGIAMEVAALPEMGLEAILESDKAGPVLLLDQVTDPHNIGAILRSAAAFDAKGIIVTRRNSASESGVLARAAAGALETVPVIRVNNLVQAMLALKSSHYWIVGLDGDAPESFHQAKLEPGRTALVLGAEGKGLRRLTGEHCDLMVKLAMSEAMESLNVSNAAAIALYEMYRRIAA